MPFAIISIHIGNNMTTISNQIVAVRPSTDVLFGDWAGSDLAAYITAYNELPISFTVTWSADMLTRTRVETYDSSIQSQIDAINAQYATQLQTESARRNAAGIVTTVTPVTAPSTGSTSSSTSTPASSS
jgi:hypothetical protein